VLEAARDLATAGPAERARHRGDRAPGDPRAAARGRRGPEDHGADVDRAAVRPIEGLDLAGVDRDDGEVAVPIDPADLAAGRAAVGEGDRDLVATDVVGVGQNLAVGDDDARPALPRADADDRLAGLAGRR